MITADQLKDVMDRADALHRYLNIDQKKVEFEENKNNKLIQNTTNPKSYNVEVK